MYLSNVLKCGQNCQIFQLKTGVIWQSFYCNPSWAEGDNRNDTRPSMHVCVLVSLRPSQIVCRLHLLDILSDFLATLCVFLLWHEDLYVGFVFDLIIFAWHYNHSELRISMLKRFVRNSSRTPHQIYLNCSGFLAINIKMCL